MRQSRASYLIASASRVLITFAGSAVRLRLSTDDDGARLFDDLCDGLINQRLTRCCELCRVVLSDGAGLVEAPVGFDGSVCGIGPQAAHDEMSLAFVAAEVMLQANKLATEVHGHGCAGGIGYNAGHPGLLEQGLFDGIAQHFGRGCQPTAVSIGREILCIAAVHHFLSFESMRGLQCAHLYQIGSIFPLGDNRGGLQVRTVEPERVLRFRWLDGQTATSQCQTEHAQGGEIGRGFRES